MAVYLDDEEKGILRYLGKGYDDSIDINDITKYLGDNGFNLTKRSIGNKLDHLIETGYVRAKTEGKGEGRHEKFYLARGIGAGVRKNMKLQGRGFIFDPSRLIKRLFGFVLLLIGAGLFLYEMPGLTGAVIGPSTSGFLVGVLFIFVGLAFFFVKPNKKKKRK